jgi:cytoskeletal protein RodZ
MNERSKPPTSAANKQGATPDPKERVGDTIRHARERRGISLETLATELKIKPHYIEALEANDYDRLPGDTYIRVYLRSICVSCSLNPEVILQRFFDERGLTGVDTLRKDSSTKINLAVVQDKEKPGPVLYIVLALIAVLVVFSFFANKQGWLPTHATGAESKKGAKQTTLVDSTESVPVPAASGEYASRGKASGPVSAVRPVPAGKGAPPRVSTVDTPLHTKKIITPLPKDTPAVAKKIADTLGKPAEVKKPIKDTSLPKVAIPKSGKDTTVLTVKIPEPKPAPKDSAKQAIASKKPVDSIQKAALPKPLKDTAQQKTAVDKQKKDSVKNIGTAVVDEKESPASSLRRENHETPDCRGKRLLLGARLSRWQRVAQAPSQRQIHVLDRQRQL